MEDQRDPAPHDIADIDSIRNLDTARMALRWALERLQKIDQEKHELSDKLQQADKTLKRAVEDQAALQKTLALRTTEADERQLYYARLEEFLSQRLEGKLDPAALAKREIEVGQLRELLDRKLAQCEHELTQRRAALEREFKLRREESERSLRERQRSLEQGAEVRAKALEQEHLSALGELREREILLRQEEKRLAERQTHFDEYYASQRAELQSQLKNHREEVEGQVRFRTQLAERALDERLAAMEGAWRRERALLSREIQAWKAKAEELAPQAIELQAALERAEEAARQARGAGDAKTLVCEEQKLGFEEALADQMRRLQACKEGFEHERKSLAAQRDEWRAKADEHLRSWQDAVSKLAAAEEEAAQARRLADNEASAGSQRALAWDRERSALAAQIDAANATHQELLRAISMLKDDASRSHAAAERAAQLRSELNDSRRAAQEMAQRLYELEHDVQAAAGDLAAAQNVIARFEAEKADWKRERLALLEELDHWRTKTSQALPRILELERANAVAEESTIQAQAAADRLAARHEEQRRAWQTERQELLSQLQALSSPPLGPKDP